VALAEGGRDVLVYTTISGAVGVLIPFASMDDVEFMTTLEMVRILGSLAIVWSEK
jgi:splicing factor 3B subunit 3